MRKRSWMLLPVLLGALTGYVLRPSPADSACCYFAAKDKDVQQPSQKVFITWDDKEKVETFTVQPKFEGNAADFGMVIPTPAKPKLDEMPRDFFKEMAVFTVLKQREFPQSHLQFGGDRRYWRHRWARRRLRRHATSAPQAGGQGGRSRRRWLAGLQDHRGRPR